MATQPLFLLGKFHGQRNLAGYSPWGHKESDTTEATWHINICIIDKQQGVLYSTENYIQYFVIVYNRKESRKEYIQIYIGIKIHENIYVYFF